MGLLSPDFEMYKRAIFIELTEFHFNKPEEVGIWLAFSPPPNNVHIDIEVLSILPLFVYMWEIYSPRKINQDRMGFWIWGQKIIYMDVFFFP